MAKKRPKPKPKPRLIRVREDKLKSMLREVTREAAQVGLATAIELRQLLERQRRLQEIHRPSS